jgi:arsenate reductase
MNPEPLSPIACDLSVFSDAECAAHLTHSQRLFAQAKTMHELPDGVAFELPNDADTLTQATQFIADERRCCPFLRFTLDLEPDGGPLWLRLSGREGVKPFLQTEFADLILKLHTPKKRVLILCTANSARSQMAEGVLRWLAGDRYEVFSAGSRATSVNPYAITAMSEIGVDIRHHASKTFERFLGQPFDAVITVCDNAAEDCPFMPGQYKRIHWSFPDPAAIESHEAKLQAFRQVRDGLIEKFKTFI